MNLALTFDDGPSNWTPPILDLLAEHDAHATFFVVGTAVPGRENVLRRILGDGHELGNHTLSHRRLSALCESDITYELSAANDVIESATGHAPTVWRAPYLDLDQRVRDIASSLGLIHVGAAVKPPDWRQPAAGTASEIRIRARDGDVVCLHDGVPPDGGTGNGTRQATVTAVAAILSGLDARYVTATELLACV